MSNTQARYVPIKMLTTANFVCLQSQLHSGFNKSWMFTDFYCMYTVILDRCFPNTAQFNKRKQISISGLRQRLYLVIDRA